jgi:hypothetical protein
MKHFIVIKNLTKEEIIKDSFVKDVSKTFAAAFELNLFLRKVKEF